MPRLHLPPPTYANVMSTLGVFIALGGVSWAAATLPRNSVGTTQLKRNAVTGAKIKDGTVGSADLAKGVLVTGPQGPTGLTGPTGATGPAGSNATLDGVAAGGALAGNYPNPTLAPSSVGTGAIADGSITSADLAAGALSGTVPGGPRLTRVAVIAANKTLIVPFDAVESVKGQLAVKCITSGTDTNLAWQWTNLNGSGNSVQIVSSFENSTGDLKESHSLLPNTGQVTISYVATSDPNHGRTVKFHVVGKNGGMLVVDGQGVANDAGLAACRVAFSIQGDATPVTVVN